MPEEHLLDRAATPAERECFEKLIPHDPHSRDPGDQWPESKHRFNRMLSNLPFGVTWGGKDGYEAEARKLESTVVANEAAPPPTMRQHRPSIDDAPSRPGQRTVRRFSVPKGGPLSAQLKSAGSILGIELLDHIIIIFNRTEYFGFLEEGKL